jgi:hypothetical protein
MPLQATSGAASYDAFGGGVPVVPAYIEEVFSTWLYTGNGSTQTITNGIDLAGEGGLTWIKARNDSFPSQHGLTDTVRGRSKILFSNLTDAEYTTGSTNDITSFNSNGFSLGTTNGFSSNSSALNYVSWTFRKQPKFFDVVTWTGTGGSRAISHALDSTPGCIILKRTDAPDNWWVVHRGASGGMTGSYGELNTNAAFVNVSSGISSIGSLTFTVSNYYNTSGATWVAYLFAHNAGGFGLTGTDNVISCGSFTTDGSGNATVNLGYEPQWVMFKASSTTGNWKTTDIMRGMVSQSANAATLNPNLSAAEGATDYVEPTSTGIVFGLPSQGSRTFIYIAIRRGPMKVPTTGTSVFGLNARTGTGANATVTGSAGVSDAVLIKNRGAAVASLFSSRLTGTGYLVTSTTAAEVAAGTTILQANPWDVMDGVKVGTTSTITNASANTYINYLFDRAPGFFDVVCYTGDGVNGRVINHNLAVAPELFIYKARSAVTDWFVVSTTNIGNTLVLNSNSFPFSTGTAIGSPTATTFTVGSVGFSNSSNTSAVTYVQYLFATCPGVSKVGNYTGNGTTQAIACGFTGGARFVLIKRRDATGDWYVYDTARGMTVLTDPYLFLNSSAAEVATLGSVITSTGGFTVNAAILAAVNTNAANYVFLAIA